jgi:ornithine cyclodeaminase/alanine dehydrogenase
MDRKSTVLLNRTQISALLDFGDYFDAVEAAFKSHGEKKTLPQGLLHLDSEGGEFHVKAGGLKLERIYFGLKCNGAFSENMPRHGLPNILGTITLCDGETGYPLAIMDSVEITRQRTAAAAAVAAKYLARPDSSVITICGCGAQGHIQLRALKRVLPLVKAFAFDVDSGQRERFSEQMSQELKMEVQPVSDPGPAVRLSDVCVTCTPSHHYYLHRADVPAGMFLAAMGADSPVKQELEPNLLVSNKVVVDIFEQCAKVGELHHALDEGLLTRHDVYAELGEIVAGVRPGRTTPEEIIIFDSTGTAMQDVASAAAVYARAVAKNIGLSINFLE